MPSVREAGGWGLRLTSLAIPARKKKETSQRFMTRPIGMQHPIIKVAQPNPARDSQAPPTKQATASSTSIVRPRKAI